MKYLQHFYKFSSSFIFEAVIKPFKSCSRLTLNITVIKQKLTFEEKICHAWCCVLLYYILGDIFPSFLHYELIFFNLSCIIKLTTKLQILTHSLSAYFLNYVIHVVFLMKYINFAGMLASYGHINQKWFLKECFTGRHLTLKTR
jgi:hypothetical protein